MSPRALLLRAADTGAVSSVNGQTGAVVLDAADVGALPDSTPIPAEPADLGAATAAQGAKADTAVQPADVDDVVREGDSRLNDTRTPKAHTHTASEVSGLPDPQTLSLSGADLSLSGGGGTVTLPSGGGGGGVGAPAPLPRVGAWLAPHWIMGGADVYPGTNGASVGGSWFVVPTPCTVDALALGVATAEASSNAKVVIYSTDATGRPSTLVLAGGSVSCATTGAKLDTLATPVTLPKGIYWAQILPSSPGGTVRFRGFSSLSDPAADLHGHLNGGNPSYSLTADCGTFATPATSLEPSATGNTRNHTLVMLRRSA